MSTLLAQTILTDAAAGPAIPTRTNCRVDFDVWSTTATLIVTDPAAFDTALAELNDELAAIDATCSRFRADSEISRVLAHPGQRVTLSPTLNAAITQALRVAAATDYLVDPTVAAAVIALGYDRDIGGVLSRSWDTGPIGLPSTDAHQPAPGAWRLQHDADTSELLVPPGIGLDLGATAKAFAADRAVARIAAIVDGGVLVNLGGDIAVAGEVPTGGWKISIADDHRCTTDARTHQLVSITSGGLATSSTQTRRWRTSAGWAHHVVDPRTGRNPEPLWRTAAVAAASCVDANAASTAAIILGQRAPEWLSSLGLPALLVDEQGSVTTVAGWPAEESR
jgi:thiamine biosynthesis lipoprotein